MSRLEYLPSSSVAVMVHVYESSTFSTRLHPGEDRAVVAASGSGGELTLFAHRTELARLRDVLAEVVAELDAAHACPAAELTAAETAA